MNMDDAELNELNRFAKLGRMSASLIHEISSPLSAALINLELSKQTSPYVRKARNDMQILQQYIEAARQQIKPESRPVVFKVNSQIEQLKQVLLPLAKHAQVKLEFASIPSTIKLYGDSVKFQQIVANLVINSIQAYSEGDAYTQASLVRIRLDQEEEWLCLEVIDWAKGIEPSELHKIFDPFYTTKGDKGQGLGLGLSTVKQYVTTDFSGSIKVSSSRRQGTRFLVYFQSLSKSM